MTLLGKLVYFSFIASAASACSVSTESTGSSLTAAAQDNIETMFQDLTSAISGDSTYLARGHTAALLSFADFFQTTGVPSSTTLQTDLANLDHSFGSLGGMLAGSDLSLGSLTRSEVATAVALTDGRLDTTGLSAAAHRAIAAQAVKVSLVIWLTTPKASSLALSTEVDSCISSGSSYDTSAPAQCTRFIDPNGTGSTVATKFTDGVQVNKHTAPDVTSTTDIYKDGSGQRDFQYLDKTSSSGYSEHCQWATGQQPQCQKTMLQSGATTCYPEGSMSQGTSC